MILDTPFMLKDYIIPITPQGINSLAGYQTKNTRIYT